MKTTVSWISNIIIIGLIIFLLTVIFIVISSRVTGDEPSLFGYQLKTVLSGSMEPEIQTGSIILIKKAKNKTKFKKDDVITFQTKDNLLITHRVTQVQKNGQRYITQGDNNNGADIDPVIAENIVGYYLGFTIPYVGYALHYLNTGQGIVFFLIIPGLLMIGYAVFTIWKTLRLIQYPQKVNE